MLPFLPALNPSGRLRTALFAVNSGTRLYLDGVDKGAATNLVIPAGISSLRLFAAGGGGGGGGGQATSGGGGGGGGGAMSVRDASLVVVPGSTLTVTLGTAGAAGAAGSNGANGTSTIISGTGMLFYGVGTNMGAGTIQPGGFLPDLQLAGGNGGVAGSGGNGGAGGGAAAGNISGGAGGTGANGSQGSFQGTDPNF